MTYNNEVNCPRYRLNFKATSYSFSSVSRFALKKKKKKKNTKLKKTKQDRKLKKTLMVVIYVCPIGNR